MLVLFLGTTQKQSLGGMLYVGYLCTCWGKTIKKRVRLSSKIGVKGYYHELWKSMFTN